MVGRENLKFASQVAITLLTFFFAFLLPLVSYLQIYPIFEETPGLLNLRPIILYIFVFSVVDGGILTGLRYIVFYFEKHTMKLALINLLSAFLFMLLLIINAQLGVVQVSIEDSYFFLDVSGIFILLIISWVTILIKTLYNIVEIKPYSRSEITLTARERLRRQGLLKCPNCKYLCRKEWKKCPICGSKLRI